MLVVIARGALKPTAPTISAVETGTNSAQVSLVKPSAEPQTGIGSYTLFRRPSGGQFAQVASVVPSGFPFTDSTLLPASTYDYALQGIDRSPQQDESPLSNIVTITTQGTAPPPPSGSIVYKPGIRIWLGSAQVMDTLANLTTKLTAIAALDVNHEIKGLCVSAPLAVLEGPTLGQYDGFSIPGQAQSECGFTKIGAVIKLCKSFGWDLTIWINASGNGYAGRSSTSFASDFAPQYMDSATYGGGEFHNTSVGPILIFWNTNVAARIIACIKAYNDKFGPDTATGGIYRWNLFQEMSIPTVSGFTTAAYLAVHKQYCQGARAAAPDSLVVVSPTFFGSSTGSDYPGFFATAFASQISIGNEDTCNDPSSTWSGRYTWGDLAFQGKWFLGTLNQPPVGPQAGFIDYTSNGSGGTPTWDFHCRVDPSELFQARSSSTYLNPVPPASIGTGYLYDNSASGFPGIFTRVKEVKAGHVDIYLDGYGGPNINRRQGVSGAPANPTPGPGAGLASLRPNIVDVITGNTSYPGIAGPLAVAWTTKPPSYP